MLRVDEYLQHDAVGLGTLVQTGAVSPAELLETAIELAERWQPELNFLTHKAYDEARASAAAMDRNDSNELLYGVPFLIKAAHAVAGWPLQRGSQLFRDEVAASDSAIVRRYREGGLLLFGQSNIPELCLTITTESTLHGPCRNPWSSEHSTGGSSGGAAAAVAAGVVPAADASDGGGSIRIPASCCGLFGFKPSRGLSVIDADLSDHWSGLSVGHVLTRSVRDSAAFLDLLRLEQADCFPLPDYAESYYQCYARDPGSLRIALQRQHPNGQALDASSERALQHIAGQCESLGCKIEEQALPVNHSALAQAMGTIINTHVARVVAPALAQRKLDLGQAPLTEATRRMAARGMKTSASDLIAALDYLQHAARQMREFHRHFDLVLSPALTMPPAPLGWLDMDGDIGEYARRFAAYSGFAALYNGTGQPSVVVPALRADNNLPVGVMLSAGWGQDHRLLQLGAALEQLSGPWLPVPQ